MNGQILKVVDKFFYLGITLSRALHILTEFQRVAKASVAFGRLREKSGSEMESSLTPRLKSTRLLYCLPSCIYVRPGQFTNVIQRDLLPLPLKLFEKAVKNQMTRQDSRHSGPEESGSAKYAYTLKASKAKMDWPCYKNA